MTDSIDMKYPPCPSRMVLPVLIVATVACVGIVIGVSLAYRSLRRVPATAPAIQAAPSTKPAERLHGWAEFVRAIHQQESGGHANPPRGDNGKARGPLQIHREYFEDSRMPAGTYADCDDLVYSINVMDRWMARYCPAEHARVIESHATAHDLWLMAARHNGGLRGERLESAQRYADSILKTIEGAK